MLTATRWSKRASRPKTLLIIRSPYMNEYKKEIDQRRTFAIISHPDAGKTTLTEKLLLFGGAIHVAGAVKSNKIKKTATSDWMEIEKQRGISVATSVMDLSTLATRSTSWIPLVTRTSLKIPSVPSPLSIASSSSSTELRG